MHTAASRRYHVCGGRRQNNENYRHVAIILRGRKAVRTSVIVPVHAHIIQLSPYLLPPTTGSSPT